MRQLNRTVEGDLPVRAASRRTIIAVVMGSAVFRTGGFNALRNGNGPCTLYSEWPSRFKLPMDRFIFLNSYAVGFLAPRGIDSQSNTRAGSSG